MIFKLYLGVLAKSCLDVKRKNLSAGSGVYKIRPHVGSLPYKVYCDMEIHRGGWTLVYSYTFTNYHSFSSGSNANINGTFYSTGFFHLKDNVFRE